MRWWLLGSVVALSLLGRGSLWAEEAMAQDPQSARWLRDYETAREIARRSGKPLCVVFRCEH
jgi:hypothetical protein